MPSSTQIQVALSYSRRNNDFAKKIIDHCKAKNFEVWYDTEDIRPTTQWREEIHNGILGSACVICLISKDYLASTICLEELDFAVKSGKKIVPVKYPDVAIQEFPETLQSIQWVSLSPDLYNEINYSNILDAVNLDIDWHNKKVYIDLQRATWKLLNKRKSAFLRGAALASAEEWLDKSDENRGQAVSDKQLSYIVASRRAESRRYLYFGVALLGLMGLLILLQLFVIGDLQFVRKMMTVAKMAFFTKEELQAAINVLNEKDILLFKISISWSLMYTIIAAILLGTLTVYYIIALKRRKPLFSKIGIGIIIAIILFVILQIIENIIFLDILSTGNVNQQPFLLTTIAKIVLMGVCLTYVMMCASRMTLFSTKWRRKTAKKFRLE